MSIIYVITAAYILHNICEIHFNDTWVQNGEDDYDQPETVARDAATGPPQNVRNALMEYFQHY